MPDLTDAQQDLVALIFRIFQDGVVDPAERDELRRFWTTRGLTVGQVRQVVDAFVARVWGEVIDDGVVTDEERVRLRALIEGLRLPEKALPDLVRKALSDR